ncbi:sporulation peptidase YabG [Gordoniibacillus kamchatkensis]|uniref:Sporulation peptidase YabG n=1 Tax=Gordoniibacillus kamchatkensis TaxID=1590651 RepID=A0ABR5AEH5_9BACL|nr:sporulation peptidase YabG [Paenibacillus sp. VKM B-2647]KIL39409.1 sporulation peptidase YabG [Paenibacillus sp. VKM B-2647]
MKQGDLVTRKSYGGDVMFRIQQLESNRAVLRGIDYRLLADAPLTDLAVVEPTEPFRYPQSAASLVQEAMQRWGHIKASLQRRRYNHPLGFAGKSDAYFEVPGKVLHLDGDSSYLRKSMALYGELRVPAEGFHVPEAEMANALYRLLPQIRPDIVVITGHDGILKTRRSDVANLSSYKNSLNFVNAVAIARQFERNRDALTIVAGACQSHFEALLQAGANFASSPGRVLIHALDPLCIAAKAAYTSIKDTVSMHEIVQMTVSGLDGLGGIETRGTFRIGIPGISQAAAAASAT